jgi:hypothetical protein
MPRNIVSINHQTIHKSRPRACKQASCIELLKLNMYKKFIHRLINKTSNNMNQGISQGESIQLECMYKTSDKTIGFRTYSNSCTGRGMQLLRINP